ncbi:MAG: beta-N-acetylhexosaminidase N-terminal domain-containing protein [Hymenobacter sp.]
MRKILLLSLSFTARAQRAAAAGARAGHAGRRGTTASPRLRCWRLRRHVTGPAGSVEESYRLRITAAGASLTAASTIGIQRGLATFRQVIEPTAHGWRAQFCDIQDAAALCLAGAAD